MEKISVIVVNWNVEESFARCIKSILDTAYPNLELILIDNASKEKPKIQKSERIKFIQNESNIGLPKAWNQGLKLATGEYVLILNPDTRLPKDFFEKSLALLKSDSTIGVMGPKFIDPDGTLQGSVFPEPSIVNTIREYWLGHKGLTQKFTPDTDVPVVVNSVSGACMLIPRDVIDRIGLFTEKVFMYFEDMDYCRRIRQIGLKVVFNPNVTIVHEHGQSSVKNPLTMKNFMDASRWYNGILKHNMTWFIIWSSQKLQKLGWVVFGHRS